MKARRGETMQTMQTVERPAVDAAQHARLESLLGEVGAEFVSDAATLEDMLGEGERFRRRGLEFVAVPPSIRELRHIVAEFRAIQAAEDADAPDVYDREIGVAQRLFWREHDGGLRPAYKHEIEDSFTRGGLTQKILETLARSGMDDKKKGTGEG